MSNILLQETTGKYTANLVDEDGVAIAGSSLNVMQITVFDLKSGTILRTTEDCLNSGDVTIDSAGLVTWNIQPYETQIVGENVPFNSTEQHFALFEVLYNASATHTATSFTFGSTVDTKLVTVNKTAHGLSVNDHVAFVDADPIGGIELDGLAIVTDVADVDNFTIKCKTTATSTDSQAQTCDAYFGGTAAKHAYQFSVRRVDAV